MVSGEDLVKSTTLIYNRGSMVHGEGLVKSTTGGIVFAWIDHSHIVSIRPGWAHSQQEWV